MGVEYEDLLGKPFRFGGRAEKGRDCWGTVMELCGRAGTPVADPFKALGKKEVTAERIEEAIRTELNVREADGPAAGRIGYFGKGSFVLACYAVDGETAVTCFGKEGVRKISLARFASLGRFFEVVPLEEWQAQKAAGSEGAGEPAEESGSGSASIGDSVSIGDGAAAQDAQGEESENGGSRSE